MSLYDSGLAGQTVTSSDQGDWFRDGLEAKLGVIITPSIKRLLCVRHLTSSTSVDSLGSLVGSAIFLLEGLNSLSEEADKVTA